MGIIEETSLVSDCIQFAILGFLAFTALLCVSLFIFRPVREVLVINPFSNKMYRIYASGCAIFVILGIICAFWEAAQIPTIIALGFYFMSFLWCIVLSKIHESIDYHRHCDDTPYTRSCTVTKHKIEHTNKGNTYYMNLLFDGEEKEVEFSDNTYLMPFFDQVEEGRRALATCIKGSLGVEYVIELKIDD